MSLPLVLLTLKHRVDHTHHCSEYGTPTDNLPEDSLIYFKTQVQLHLRSLNLPWAIYYTGWFSDTDFIPPLGIDIVGKTLTIVGNGNTGVSFTTRADVANYVAYTLTNLPEDRLKNATFRIEGEKKTLRELKPIFEQVFGGEFTIKTRDVADVEKLVREGGETAFMDSLLLITEKEGLGPHDNAVVPGFTPLNVADTLKKYYT